MILFSYGSNHPEQLAARLGHPVETEGAYVKGYERVFCGMSQRWNGGVASLRKAPGAVTYGLITEVSADDLYRLDIAEGIALGSYQRTTIRVHGMESGPQNAYVYTSLRKQFYPPSRAYLEAVAKTIGTHWAGENGKVTWRDVTVRPCR